MYGYIYKRVNKSNGKIYVGQHKYNKPEIDPKYKGSGVYFGRALKQEGDAAFTNELIDIAESLEELNEKEIYWIEKLGSRVPDGYNISLGGQPLNLTYEDRVANARKAIAIRTAKNWKQSEEFCKRASEFMKERPVTDEFREHCRIAKLGNTNGAGNKDMFWITDGVDNFKLHKGAEYDPAVYKGGRTLTQETLDKYKASYEDRIYVHKDGKDKYIHESDLSKYLDDGYDSGRAPETYANRGAAISTGKKGKIGIRNSSGKVKYIDVSQLELYIEQGFMPISKKLRETASELLENLNSH